MKFLTTSQLFSDSLAAVRRFFFPFLAILTMTTAAVALIFIDMNSLGDEMGAAFRFWIPLLLTAGGFYILSLGLNLFLEQGGKKSALWPQVLLAVLMVPLFFYYNYLFSLIDGSSGYFFEEYVFFKTLFLNLVFFVLYLGAAARGGAQAFLNGAIFFVKRTFWAMVIFGGLFLGVALLFTGLNELVQVNISERFYMLLWTFSTLFLAQIYYLAGVPKSFVKMADLDLRAGLMNYILVPLAALYLVLLYAGLAKLIFFGGLDLYSLHDWTLVFVIFGLMVYFFSAFLAKESALTTFFRKAFFPLVLPLTFVSIYFLVTKEDAVLYADSYYYVQVIAMALLALFSFYFIVSRQKDLRMLGAFALWFFALSFLVANYWNVSMKMDRLEGKLVEKGAYVDGEIVPASIAPEELGSEIVILIEGLAGVPGSHLEEFFGESYPQDLVVVDRLQGRLLQVLTGEVGENYYDYAVSDAGGYFYYTAENYCDLFNGCSIDIEGFDLLSRVQADSTYAQMNDVYYSQGTGVLLTYQLDNFNELSFFDAYGNRLGAFDLSGLRDKVQTNEALSAAKMTAPAPIPNPEPPSDLRIPAEANVFEFDGSGFKAKFLLSSVEGYEEGKVSYVAGILLVDFQ